MYIEIDPNTKHGKIIKKGILLFALSIFLLIGISPFLVLQKTPQDVFKNYEITLNQSGDNYEIMSYGKSINIDDLNNMTGNVTEKIIIGIFLITSLVGSSITLFILITPKLIYYENELDEEKMKNGDKYDYLELNGNGIGPKKYCKVKKGKNIEDPLKYLQMRTIIGLGIFVLIIFLIPWKKIAKNIPFLSIMTITENCSVRDLYDNWGINTNIRENRISFTYSTDSRSKKEREKLFKTDREKRLDAERTKHYYYDSILNISDSSDRIIFFYGKYNKGEFLDIDLFAFVYNRVWQIKEENNKAYLIPFTPTDRRDENIEDIDTHSSDWDESED